MVDSEGLNPQKRDKAYTAIKAAIALIPGVGGSIAELLPMIIAPPLEKRRNQWLSDIAKSLKSLEDEVTPFLWTDFAIQPATFTRPLVALPLVRN